MFALRAHPTRTLRGGRIYARLGLEGRGRKRGVACADVRLLEYERYPLPREGDDVVGETHGAKIAGDAELRRSMGECGMKAAAQYAWDALAARLCDFCRAL